MAVPPLTYHQATFDLIGKKPKPSKAARAALESRERELGITFPASLREFYALSGACDILTDHSNQDPAVPVERLGESEYLERGLLLIQDENQGCAEWFVRLDGSDDPPVEIASEAEFLEPTHEEWDYWDVVQFRRVAHRFSDYVYGSVLTYGGGKRDRKTATKLKAYGVDTTFDAGGRAVSLFFHKERLDRPGFSPALPLDEAGMTLVRKLDRVEKLDVYRPAAEVAGWAAIGDHPGIARIDAPDALDDSAVAPLLTMPALNDLSIGVHNISDEALDRLLRGRKFTSLDINLSGRVSERWMPALADQTGLETLEIVDLDATMDDGPLRHIAGLSGLQTLKLVVDLLTDEGLVHLAGLTGLACLKLVRAQVSGSGFRHLTGLLRLRELDVRQRPIVDGSLEHLAAFGELEILDLAGSKIVGPGLAFLSGLSKLQRLDLGGCKLEEVHLRHLTTLPSLERLDLTQTGVTDEGIRPLAALQTLQHLEMGGCNVSAAMIHELKAAIPGLSYVTWTPPGKNPSIGNQFKSWERPAC